MLHRLAPRALLALVAGGAVACGGAALPVPPPARVLAPASPAPVLARAVAPPPSPCAARARRAVKTASRSGSSLALVEDGPSRLVYVADEEGNAIHTVDADALEELAVTELTGSPEQILPLADGRILVTLRDQNRLVALEPGATPREPLQTRCERPTYTEPFGLAVSPDGARVAVTAGWDHRLMLFDAAGLDLERTVELPAEPRGVLLSSDGESAYVAHLVGGVVSVVSLGHADQLPGRIPTRPTLAGATTGRPPAPVKELAAAQGFALAELPMREEGGKAWPTRVFVPMASSDPMRFGAEASFPSAYGGGGGGPAVIGAFVAVVDPGAREALGAEIAGKRVARPEDCILPRGITTYRDRLLVTCMGTDRLVDLDARAADPITAERNSTSVAPGPTGVVVDERNDRALVASAWAHALTIVPLDRGAPHVLDLAHREAARLSPKLERGRQLFHAVRDVRLSFDGRACASCHPDGRADGLTWATPDGPRQTILLAGRADRAGPFGWFGDHPGMKNHLNLTLARLGGHGLEATRADAGDLDALIAYVRSMKLPSRRGALVDGGVEALRGRGRELFYADETGCSTCHLGERTDGQRHDVGSGDAREAHLAFATPALRGVAASAPYFPDGRYPTLLDLLADPASKMGRSAQLSLLDRRALAAYLESL